jgi:hypothetical protein
MKRADAIFWLVVFCIFCCAGVSAFVIAHATPKPPHPVCLISHKSVILIPTVCGAHEVCARPIVAELCDSVEMPAK